MIGGAAVGFQGIAQAGDGVVYATANTLRLRLGGQDIAVPCPGTGAVTIVRACDTSEHTCCVLTIQETTVALWEVTLSNIACSLVWSHTLSHRGVAGDLGVHDGTLWLAITDQAHQLTVISSANMQEFNTVCHMAVSHVPMLALCLCPSNSHLSIAITFTDASLRLFSLDGSLLFSSKDSEGWMQALAFDPSGLLACGDGSGTLSLYTLILDSDRPTLQLEAVLQSHDGAITGACWSQDQRLVTCSMDCSIVCWEKVDGRWEPEHRIGDTMEQFMLYSVTISADGSRIAAISYSGAVYTWAMQDGRWLSVPFANGHADRVVDICWHPSGKLFLSTSKDRTTRIYAHHEGRWVEVARPQIHGYAMQCAVFLGQSLRFASGAEEKIVRVFDATASFVRLLQSADPKLPWSEDDRVNRVVLPELGLSNLEETRDIAQVQDEEAVPPSESYLSKYALFPEVNKLYGHGYDIFRIASNRAGTLLASSCAVRQAQKEHAAVRIWDLTSHVQVMELKGHDLTAVDLQFSPNDQYLLSVSRDRSFVVYDMHQQGRVVSMVRKAHSRIIWSCSWSPCSSRFITGSRDKTASIWDRESGRCLSSHTFYCSVNAVAWNPVTSDTVVAIGLENGAIAVYAISDDFTWALTWSSPPMEQHGLAVSRLQWHPSDAPCLLSASADWSVRVWSAALRSGAQP